MRTRRPITGGFGFPLGFLAAILTTLAAVAAGAAADPLISLLALACVTAGIAALSTPRATLATAAVCWALHSGFVLGRHGQLAFTPAAAHAALVLAGVAILGSGAALALRTALAPRTARPIRLGYRTPAGPVFAGR